MSRLCRDLKAKKKEPERWNNKDKWTNRTNLSYKILKLLDIIYWDDGNSIIRHFLKWSLKAKSPFINFTNVWNVLKAKFHTLHNKQYIDICFSSSDMFIIKAQILLKKKKMWKAYNTKRKQWRKPIFAEEAITEKRGGEGRPR